MSKHLIYELNNQEVGLRIKASEVNRDLPIMGNAYEGSMDLLSPLPFRQQKPGIATIFDLLQQEFPKSTGLIFDKKNISKIVFAAPIPVNKEGKGEFSLQIDANGQIAYIAWNSLNLVIGKDFKEKVCDILLEKGKVFCGPILSQENPLTASKVTVIGIVKSSRQVGSNLYNDSLKRVPCEGISKDPITLGMFEAQRAHEGIREKHSLFCIEIVPQFSSEESPIGMKDLEMAIKT